MNKKGSNFNIWAEVLIFLILFVAVMAVIGLEMNSKYGKSHDLTFGLNMSNQLSQLQSYKSDSINSSTGGQASVTDFGVLKLLTTPKLLLDMAVILWGFVNGSFIWTVVGMMNLGVYGYYIALLFQILYVIAIVFILLKLVLRIPI